MEKVYKCSDCGKEGILSTEYVDRDTTLIHIVFADGSKETHLTLGSCKSCQTAAKAAEEEKKAAKAAKKLEIIEKFRANFPEEFKSSGWTGECFPGTGYYFIISREAVQCTDGESFEIIFLPTGEKEEWFAD